MPATTYNEIAGQSVERLAALSDGIFGVAMTLLVLDLRVPAAEAIHNEKDLLHALAALAPQLIMYMMSFLTLGIFWIGQQTQLNHLKRAHRSAAWMHLFFLFAVTLTPFSTRLLAEHNTYRTALLAYSFNILLLGATLYATWTCAAHLNLLKDDLPATISQAIKRRIVIAQSLYAAAAALCLINTHWSIAAMVAVQLYYAIAPKFGRAASQSP
ncbi:MAG: TMEM175 family protein [Candidatus Acidiferrales bacterium]